LKDEFDQEMDIRHWKYDKKEGKKKERIFKCKILKKTPGLTLLLPERQFFVQLIKFAPGKGPKDYNDFYKEVDERLRKMYDGDRCGGLDIHEIVSFLTWGRYDMVVLWDAPDMITANKFLAAWVDPNDYGSSENLPGSMITRHPIGG
jgi:uncharacterized protein with GYD domain